MPPRSVIALYGNTSLKRVYCPSCSGWTIVLDGLRQCCDRLETREAQAFVRICQPEYRRRLPPKRIRDEILASQGHACLYCERTFGSYTADDREIKLQWDHMVPWSHSMDNHGHNFAAVCQFCNQRKSNLMFQTVDEVRAYVAKFRAEEEAPETGLPGMRPAVRDIPGVADVLQQQVPQPSMDALPPSRVAAGAGMNLMRCAACNSKIRGKIKSRPFCSQKCRKSYNRYVFGTALRP